MTNETTKVFGVIVQFTVEKERFSYLLVFPAAEGEALVGSIDLLITILDDYDIHDAVLSSLIAANSDYKLNSTARQLSFSQAVDRNHTVDRLVKRVTNEWMPKISQDCMRQFQKLNSLPV